MYLFFSFFFFVVKKKNVSSTLSANFKYAIQFCKLYSQCWSLELIYLHNLKFCMTWQVFPLPHYLETTVLLFSSIYLTILDSTYKETMHYLSFCEVKWSEVAQSCLTLCHSMYYDLPGSSVCGILQTRILEWVAISFSRVSSWPRGRTHLCTTGRFFMSEPLSVCSCLFHLA